MKLGGALAVFLMTFCCLAPSATEAARFSGAYLLQICAMDERGRELVRGGHAACQAYISGVIDYHNLLRSLRISPEINICVPADVTFRRLQLIVLRYLQSNPTHDGFVAAPAVTMALFQEYPCR